MKTASTNLLNHLAEEATTLTTCWEITRTDGTVIRLTELDVSITVPSTTVGSIGVGGGKYQALYGFDRTAIDNAVGLDPDTTEINGILNSEGIDDDDIRAGLYNGADLKIFVVNYMSLADGVMALKRGQLGEVVTNTSGQFQTELQSLSAILRKKMLEKTSPTCRALFGDSRCTIPVTPAVIARSTAYAVGDFVRVPVTAGTTSEIYGNLIYECTVAGTTDASQPTYDTTPGNTTVDGTASFKAYQSWKRHGSVTSVTDKRTLVLNVTESRAVDDWFNGGVIAFESGPNAGIAMEVKDWVQSSNTVTLFLPFPYTPGVGNVFTIYPGCNRTRTACKAFALAGSQDYANGNVMNFRGEPDLPGRDFVLTYPDAE